MEQTKPQICLQDPKKDILLRKEVEQHAIDLRNAGKTSLFVIDSLYKHYSHIRWDTLKAIMFKTIKINHKQS